MRYDTRNRTSLSLRPNQSTTSMRPVLGRGEKGQDGSNVLPTDEAIANAIDTPGSDTATSLSASIAQLKVWARDPENMLTGARTVNTDGAITTGAVVWPDGATGTYTATTLSTAFPGATDAYTITRAGSPATTYTQPAVTRNAAGAITTRPAITVA